jgi:hypothetical protein
MSHKNSYLKNAFNVQFEYTAPNSPQYNSRVERKFVILYSKMRTLFACAGLSENLKYGLWAEASKYYTKIENLIVKVSKVIPSELQTGLQLKVQDLHQFGEMAVIANQ